MSLQQDESKCKHCRAENLSRVQGPDELSWLTDNNNIMIELWQCDDCGKYTTFYFQFVKAVALMEGELWK